jgi:hypothetical protein
MTGIAEGRYAGAFRPDGLTFEARIARNGDGRFENLSGDVFAGAEHVLSFVGRASALSESTDGRLTGMVSFFSSQPLQRNGSSIAVSLLRSTGAGASISLTLDLGAGDVTAELERIGPELRTLRIDMDGLAGLPEPDASLLDGDQNGHDLVAALRRASIAATVHSSPFRPDTSGRKRHTMAELHALMQDWSQPVQANQQWRLHVLFANRFDGRNGDDVSGIMYDVEPGMRPARQGLAVFLNSSTIKGCEPANCPDWRREVAFTLVHEIGHALNLPHAFEDGRAEALTWMNYPERTAIGAAAFWSQFKGVFDLRELAFLHHAPFCDIAPGQYDYAQRDSDLLSGGGFPAFRKTCHNTHHSQPVKAALAITPLKLVYAFGEPIFLKASVTNSGRKPIAVAKALDPSDGFLSIQVRTPLGKVRHIRPPAALCQRTPIATLRHRQSVSFDGILASFDADGPIFDEPGRYRIDATFTGVTGASLTSPPVYLRVLHPGRAEEIFAISIWDDPQLMRAIYCRQPLLALDSWRRLVDETAQALAADHGNTSVAYLKYISAIGWLSSFAPASRTKKYLPRKRKAAAHLSLVETRDLPSGVRLRRNELISRS